MKSAGRRRDGGACSEREKESRELRCREGKKAVGENRERKRKSAATPISLHISLSLSLSLSLSHID